ncbi:hypothetical protein GCM10023158_07050 [Gluconacetobacter tumulicola]
MQDEVQGDNHVGIVTEYTDLHERPAFTQAPQAGCQITAANKIYDGIDASTIRCRLDAGLPQFSLAIQNHVRTQPLNVWGTHGACGCNNTCSECSRQLNAGRTNATSRRMDQDRLTSRYIRQMVQHLDRCHEGFHDGAPLDPCQGRRNLDRHSLIHSCVVCVSATAHDSHDSVARLEPCDITAYRLDLSRKFETQQMTVSKMLTCVKAVPLQNIRPVDACRMNTNDQIIRPQNRKRGILDTQYIRRAEIGIVNGPHCALS